MVMIDLIAFGRSAIPERNIDPKTLREDGVSVSGWNGGDV